MMKKIGSPGGAVALLGVAPVGAGTEVDQQGDAQAAGAFHFALHDARDVVQLGGRAFEYELVVDLEEHGGLVFAGGQGGGDANHGELDHIGGSALERGIHRGAFGEAARVRVTAVDIGYRAFAAEE